MRERRFMLYEVEWFCEDMMYKQYTITETELKRRLDIINGTVGPEDRWINILLHGETVKGE